MYIDPIHAGPVALAHALVLAARTRTQSGSSDHAHALDGTARRRQYQPLQRLARWWRELDAPAPAHLDPTQLMLWSECIGRPHLTAVTGLLMMEHYRGRLAEAGDKGPDSR
jgi:hypothetical protein